MNPFCLHGLQTGALLGSQVQQVSFGRLCWQLAVTWSADPVTFPDWASWVSTSFSRRWPMLSIESSLSILLLSLSQFSRSFSKIILTLLSDGGSAAMSKSATKWLYLMLSTLLSAASRFVLKNNTRLIASQTSMWSVKILFLDKSRAWQLHVSPLKVFPARSPLKGLNKASHGNPSLARNYLKHRLLCFSISTNHIK